MAAEDPPGSEPKSERFNMFISKPEITAIEEWAWKKRIRSKSEAVRRLVQMGLVLDENAVEAAEDFLNLNDCFQAEAESLLNFVQEIGGADREKESPNFDRLVLISLGLTMNVQEQLSYLEHRLNIIFQSFQTLDSQGSFEEIKEKLAAVKAEAVKEALANKIDMWEVKNNPTKQSQEDPKE